MTTPATVNMLTVRHTDGPTFNTRSWTKKNSPDTTSTPHLDVSPKISPEATPTPKPLTADRLEALLKIQRTDPFCNHISKCLLNGKAPQHKTDSFIHIKGLLNKHIVDSGKQFSCPPYPEILEVYSLGGSSQQTRPSSKLPHLLFNKKTILLERNEQEH